MSSETTADPSTTVPASRHIKVDATDLSLVAAFAALIGALAYLGAVPVGGQGVPITLQSFGVGLAGALLGPWRGFFSVALYLALGAVGLPVFAEHSSGIGVFAGPSGGYLIAFPIAALVIGALVRWVAGERGKTRAITVFACLAAGSVLVIHPFGIVGMSIFFDVSLAKAATFDAPFWLGDLVKCTLGALVAAEVHRAFPRLLPARR